MAETTSSGMKCKRCGQAVTGSSWINNDGPYCAICANVVAGTPLTAFPPTFSSTNTKATFKPMFSPDEERRMRALEIAVRQAHSQYDAASIIGNAKRFEEFLRGREEGA